MLARVGSDRPAIQAKDKVEMLCSGPEAVHSDANGALSDSTASGDLPSPKGHFRVRGKLTMSKRKLQKAAKAKRASKARVKAQVQAYLQSAVPQASVQSKDEHIASLDAKVACIESVISAASKMLEQLLGTL